MTQPDTTHPGDFAPLRFSGDQRGVQILDQTRLPHEERWLTLEAPAQYLAAIRDMQVRGAPLIGITAAFGIAVAMRADAGDAHLEHWLDTLAQARPTAVNLRWALERMRSVLQDCAGAQRAACAWQEAEAIWREDLTACRRIGEYGADLLCRQAAELSRPLRVMTHCNAGALATAGWGTATAAIYVAAERGCAVEVWVSETRPRVQGALTAWEMRRFGIAHRLFVDNAAGHLIANGAVDVCIVGADRVAANGDVCNKIGTYLKALACDDHRVPFYVALPLSTVDVSCADAAAVEIEERGDEEVLEVGGLQAGGASTSVRIAEAGTPVCNPGFDCTPARLVSGLITEYGVADASADGVRALLERRHG